MPHHDIDNDHGIIVTRSAGPESRACHRSATKKPSRTTADDAEPLVVVPWRWACRPARRAARWRPGGRPGGASVGKQLLAVLREELPAGRGRPVSGAPSPRAARRAPGQAPRSCGTAEAAARPRRARRPPASCSGWCRASARRTARSRSAGPWRAQAAERMKSGKSRAVGQPHRLHRQAGQAWSAVRPQASSGRFRDQPPAWLPSARGGPASAVWPSFVLDGQGEVGAEGRRQVARGGP